MSTVYGSAQYEVGNIAAMFTHIVIPLATFTKRPPEMVDTEACQHRRPATHEPHVITVCPIDGSHIHWRQHLMGATQ